MRGEFWSPWPQGEPLVNPDANDPKRVFGSAKWIWPTAQGYDLVNCFVQARRSFRVSSLPKRSVIRVTADSRYKLFVNGRFVCRGPARGFQLHWPYDEVDIAPNLKRGANVIAVLVHNLGIGNFHYISEDAGGVILFGRAGAVDLSTGPLWRLRRAPGYVRHMTRLSQEMGFEEIFDARLDDGGWILPSYDDSSWKNPVPTAAGAMPWHAVEPRGIPMLRQEILAPLSVVAQCSGPSPDNFREATNITANYLAEKRPWRRPSISFKRLKSGLSLEVPATGPGRFRAYVLDFGREVVGTIGLAVAGAYGGEIVDVQASETVTGLAPDVADPSVDCKVAMAGRLTLRKGTTRHEQFEIWGTRYLALVVRDARRHVRVSVYLRTALYPLEVRAAFKSSDAMLDDVYRICVRAQQCCMIDAYVDCPWREQAQWWGDARVQAANTFHLSADARLLARGIRQIAAQQTPNGLTYGLTPTTSHHCILPDYTLTWIMTIWDYYRQTGDVSLIREEVPRMLRALSYFEGITAENGLLPYDDRYWLFLDWADVFKDGYPAIYNVLYFWALETAAALLRLVGMSRQSARLAKLAAASREAVMKNLFDHKRLRFFGGLTWKNRPVVHDCAHSYALAILSGLCPRYDGAFVDRVLVPLVKGPVPLFAASADGALERLPREPSPFFMYYVFEALKRCGRKAEVVDCIRRWYGRFVEEGFTTTPEMWGMLKGRWSACHAWSAHPLVHLLNILLGVTQDSVGWRRVRFEPFFGDLDFAEGAVATPLGVVESSWRRDGPCIKVELSLPARVSALVRLPGITKTVRDGRHSWIVRP